MKAYGDFERDIASFKMRRTDYVNFGQSCESNDVFTAVEMSAFREHEYEQESIVRRLRTVEGDCAAMREKVLAGELDYAEIVATSMNDALFDYEVARRGRIHIAVRCDDPLACQDEIRIRDLCGRRFATQGPGYDIHDYLESQALGAGFSLEVCDIMSGLSSRIGRVESGLALTYAYRDISFPKAAPHVICLPLAEPSAQWMYCSVGKKGVADPYLLRFFAGKEGPFADIEP